MAAASELIRTSSLGKLWMIHWQGQPIGYVAVTFGFTLEFYGRTATIDELFVGPNTAAMASAAKRSSSSRPMSTPSARARLCSR